MKITIRDFRESKKLNQQELADLIGVSRQTIVNLEGGLSISKKFKEKFKLKYPDYDLVDFEQNIPPIAQNNIKENLIRALEKLNEEKLEKAFDRTINAIAKRDRQELISLFYSITVFLKPEIEEGEALMSIIGYKTYNQIKAIKSYEITMNKIEKIVDEFLEDTKPKKK
jgi:DNA-binding XRE family transcriptional regulator